MNIAELKAAAETPYAWVLDSPGYFDPATGGEPPYTDFSDVEKPGYRPLVQANPSTILSLIARIEALEEALKNQNEWVQGALDCKDWTWDGAQREAAEWSLSQARTALQASEKAIKE